MSNQYQIYDLCVLLACTFVKRKMNKSAYKKNLATRLQEENHLVEVILITPLTACSFE